eukprot:CAMPEP_0119145886 /NCGR_PEP_ID=MMETSP1310-20130426/38113_1 /TAXON_ID=464262 /ORGANISM="Genus nov. species nov., Strain RCC2339" /LENGTH=648 /DNA_ID=CAMNT_0007137729 /DNA_START=73 /DNA_END=2019 /DNA_ORIENTATION=+
MEFVMGSEVARAEEIHRIEAASYPGDEAGSLRNVRLRAALPFFYQMKEGCEIVGYINGSTCTSATLTEESMDGDDVTGWNLCIHSVVVKETHRSKGLGSLMLRNFIQEIEAMGGAFPSRRRIERMSLIAKSRKARFYIRAGFEYLRRSPIVHGAEAWYEFRRDLGMRSCSQYLAFTTPNSRLPWMSGNAAAVVEWPRQVLVAEGADDADARDMQEMAACFKQAETSFVYQEGPLVPLLDATLPLFHRVACHIERFRDEFDHSALAAFIEEHVAYEGDPVASLTEEFGESKLVNRPVTLRSACAVIAFARYSSRPLAFEEVVGAIGLADLKGLSDTAQVWAVLYFAAEAGLPLSAALRLAGAYQSRATELLPGVDEAAFSTVALDGASAASEGGAYDGAAIQRAREAARQAMAERTSPILPMPLPQFQLRWFTPTVEVMLCGHATLAAAAHLFAKEDYLRGITEIRFRTRRSGGLVVRRDPDGRLELSFPAHSLEPLPVDDAVVDSCFEAGEVGRVWAQAFQTYSSPRTYTDVFVVLNANYPVEGVRVDQQAILKAFPKHRGMIITRAAGKEAFESRYFAPQSGIPEDSVTGSTHCALAPYWAKELSVNHLDAYQRSARGGHLRVAVDNTRVRIAGRVSEFFSGRVSLP